MQQQTKFLVTAFMGGEVIETIATRHELHERLDWCEDDYPILECESIDTPVGRIAMTMTIRRATQEELERVND